MGFASGSGFGVLGSAFRFGVLRSGSAFAFRFASLSHRGHCGFLAQVLSVFALVSVASAFRRKGHPEPRTGTSNEEPEPRTKNREP